MTEPGSGASQPYTYPLPAGASRIVHGEVSLSDEPPVRTPGSRRRPGLVVGAVVAALALGGAGAVAFQALNGSGSQPAEVLPGDSYAYFRLDIDPSAGQKIAAVRFLGKLPQVKDNLDNGDPRKKLWDLAAKEAGSGCLSKFGYDTDIAPWLGDRVGVAIRPGGTAKQPNVALAIQVKDEASAKDTLTRLLACDTSGTPAEVRMRDGYAIVTPRGVGDATLAAVDKGSLAANTTFSQDMAALGEQGVMSGWVDLSTGAKQLQQLGGSSELGALGGMGGMGSITTAAGARGRFAMTLRFSADYVELAGKVRGADGTTATKGDGAELASLPANTMAALHVAGADEMLRKGWPTIEKQLEGLGSAGAGSHDVTGEIERQLGMKVPDDLEVLLGRSFTLAAPSQTQGAETPTIGAKVVSSDAKRADELVGRLLERGGAPSSALTHKVDGDRLFVATTPGYADDLQSGGRLGDTDAFKLAMGDVSGSNAALFVDLDKVDQLAQGQVHGEAKSFLESLRALGLNASSTGNGEGTFTLRLVGD